MLFATMVAVGSASANCSNATLNGVYGFLVVGSAYGEPRNRRRSAQLRWIGECERMSKRRVTTEAIYYLPAFTGTYSMAKDCTGTMLSGYAQLSTLFSTRAKVGPR